MHGRRLLRALALLALIYTEGVPAELSDVHAREVQHLLEYLRTSGCAMERNGERHSGEDAYAHVMKKYDYFRDDIGTSEEFIELAATKSTMSGEYYLVVCPDAAPMRTRDWLLEELRRYRG